MKTYILEPSNFAELANLTDYSEAELEEQYEQARNKNITVFIHVGSKPW